MFQAQPAVVNATTSSSPSSSSSVDSSAAPTPHPNPIGAHPDSPGGDQSKRNTAIKLDMKGLRVLVALTAFIGAPMAL